MKHMKFFLVFLLAFTLAIPMNASANTTFSDIPKNYRFAEEIDQLVNSGVINGYQDGTFKPNQPVSRAQVATMLTRALKLDVDNVKPANYKDVSTKSPAYKAIAAVTEAGIMKGDQANFKPNALLTRSQMAIVLTRAFDLKGDGSASFKDVPKDYYSYKHIDAILTNGVTTGYPDRTFRPGEPTTRVHFAAFLSRALNNTDQRTDAEKEELTNLLKKVYENEFALGSYSFDGSFNMGLTFPEELRNSEMGMFADMLEDIQVEMTGAYVKDPMRLEANVKLTMTGELGITMNLPMIMTEEKMWFKLPQTPMIPMPEELEGKFIEVDLAELQEMEGQPAGSMDYNLQMELASAINQLFVEQFSPDFYHFTKADNLKIPGNIDVQKVVKFELKNETLQPFVEKLMTGFLPEFFKVIQEPKYASILGITDEEFEEAKEGFNLINEHLDEIVASIHDTLSINALNQHIVIDKNNFIAYDTSNIDLDITSAEGVFNLKMKSTMLKENFNEKLKFKMEIPSKHEVITLKELEDLSFDELDM